MQFFQAATPKSQEMTALAMYAITCQAFVFVAFVEFALLLLLERMKQTCEQQKNTHKEQQFYCDQQSTHDSTRMLVMMPLEQDFSHKILGYSIPFGVVILAFLKDFWSK